MEGFQFDCTSSSEEVDEPVVQPSPNKKFTKKAPTQKPVVSDSDESESSESELHSDSEKSSVDMPKGRGSTKKTTTKGKKPKNSKTKKSTSTKPKKGSKKYCSEIPKLSQAKLKKILVQARRIINT